MAHQEVDSPTAHPAVRLTLLALLPLIAALLYLDGRHYDPDLLDFSGSGQGEPEVSLFPARLAGLNPFGQVRTFDQDNLYEYINGHAEYYIGAGFQGLAVGEFGGDAQSGPQVVVNAYDMDSALNAFGVLVHEAGEQDPVTLGALGFRSDQGVHFIHGPYYVQLTLFDPSIDALAAGRELVQGLAEQVPAGQIAFSFPDFGQVTATHYVREYYRGMEFFNRVLEREFERDGETFQAFSIAGETADTQKLVEELLRFIDDEGMTLSDRTEGGLTLYLVEDPYEGPWFFTALDSGLIGVYAPFDEGFAEALQAFAAESGA